jgi:uncharacterized protein involved in exopolysaccharide biosynthesis
VGHSLAKQGLHHFVTAVFALSAVAYALLAQQWFKAETVLVPAKRNQALPGQLGGLAGLANLAGVNIGDKTDTTESLAVLQSNDVAREFIEERKLLPVLYADEWDSALTLKSDDPEDPDIRDHDQILPEDDIAGGRGQKDRAGDGLRCMERPRDRG